MAYLRPREGRIISQHVKGHKLTPKMVSLVDAYFGEAMFNTSKAVELSDYKTAKNVAAQASELFQHPLIRAEVDKRLKEKTARSEVRADYIINKLMQIVEKEQEDNPNAALRGLELLGKSIAIWRDRQEISGPDGEAIQHEQKIKESVDDFTTKIANLARRNESNVVPIK